MGPLENIEKAPCLSKHIYTYMDTHTFACDLRVFPDCPNSPINPSGPIDLVWEPDGFCLVESSGDNVEMESVVLMTVYKVSRAWAIEAVPWSVPWECVMHHTGLAPLFPAVPKHILGRCSVSIY